MPMKLAMLGMWHSHANGIVRRVAENPDEFRLVAFYDPDPQVVAERRERWEPLLGSVSALDSPEQVLRQSLDGVVVDGKVHENVAMARLALEAGLPVMLEKPAGENLEDYQQIVDLAQRKHLHLQMIYLFRYMSAVQEMLGHGRRGELGRIYEFRARLPKHLGNYDHFVEELARYSGGMFFEMAGHVIDMMVALLGRPKNVSPFLGHHHSQPGTYVDNGVGVFEFDHAWGIIEVPALEVAPHSRRIEVYGTEGACAIPHLGSGHLANANIQPIDVYRAGDEDWQTLELEAATLQIADLREFAAVVAGKKKPDFDMEHDLVVQEALLRASGML